MTSTAPAKTVKTAAAATTRGGGVRLPGQIACAGGHQRHRPVPRAHQQHPVGTGEGKGKDGGGDDAGVDALLTIELLEVIGIGRTLARAIRSCKQHGRASNKREGWQAAAKSGGGVAVVHEGGRQPARRQGRGPRRQRQ